MGFFDIVEFLKKEDVFEEDRFFEEMVLGKFKKESSFWLMLVAVLFFFGGMATSLLAYPLIGGLSLLAAFVVVVAITAREGR